MSDDLVKRLRWMGHEDTEAAADCIEALTKELARSTRLISKMVPLSACGNYVFWDGVGDIELDHNGELRSRIEALTSEVGELQEVFDFQWRANMRAVEMWRTANPGNELVLPDSAKLTVWMLEQLEAARADAKEAEAYAEELAECNEDFSVCNQHLKTQVTELQKQFNICRMALAKAMMALQGSRETILQLVNSRGSEAEGADEDWVGDIDATLAEIEGEKG
jgi:hypothetical protein